MAYSIIANNNTDEEEILLGSVEPLGYYSYDKLSSDSSEKYIPACIVPFGDAEKECNPEYVAVLFARDQIYEAIQRIEELYLIVEEQETAIAEVMAMKNLPAESSAKMILENGEEALKLSDMARNDNGEPVPLRFNKIMIDRVYPDGTVVIEGQQVVW